MYPTHVGPSPHISEPGPQHQTTAPTAPARTMGSKQDPRTWSIATRDPDPNVDAMPSTPDPKTHLPMALTKPQFQTLQPDPMHQNLIPRLRPCKRQDQSHPRTLNIKPQTPSPHGHNEDPIPIHQDPILSPRPHSQTQNPPSTTGHSPQNASPSTSPTSSPPHPSPWPAQRRSVGHLVVIRAGGKEAGAGAAFLLQRISRRLTLGWTAAKRGCAPRTPSHRGHG